MTCWGGDDTPAPRWVTAAFLCWLGGLFVYALVGACGWW